MRKVWGYWTKLKIRQTFRFAADLLISNFIEIRLAVPELEHLNFLTHTAPLLYAETTLTTNRPNAWDVVLEIAY